MTLIVYFWNPLKRQNHDSRAFEPRESLVIWNLTVPMVRGCYIASHLVQYDYRETSLTQIDFDLQPYLIIDLFK